ncbi:hypothetical protein GCM10017688_15990 [Streptomyces ramulosus]
MSPDDRFPYFLPHRIARLPTPVGNPAEEDSELSGARRTTAAGAGRKEGTDVTFNDALAPLVLLTAVRVFAPDMRRLTRRALRDCFPTYLT